MSKDTMISFRTTEEFSKSLKRLAKCQRNSKSDPPLPIFGKLKLTHPTYSSACMTGIC